MFLLQDIQGYEVWARRARTEAKQLVDQRVNKELQKLNAGMQGAFQALSRCFDRLEENQKILDRRLAGVENKLDIIINLFQRNIGNVQAAAPAAVPPAAAEEPDEAGGAAEGDVEEDPLPEHPGKSKFVVSESTVL